MATITERTTGDGQTHYRVLIRLKGHAPVSATFERKTDARRFAQQTEAAIQEGRYFKTTEAKRHTLAELIDRYSRDHLPRLKTAQSRGGELRWWRKEAGHALLADVTSAFIVEHRDKLMAEDIGKRGKRAPASVNRYLATLSHCFTVAVKEYGWCDANPLANVRKLKEPRGRVRFLENAELTRLLEACRESPSPALYPVVVLAVSTGMRRGEIIGLEWPDVDFARNRLTLHETKNGERRTVPLAGHALDVMREWAKVRRLDTPRVFAADIRSAWETARRKAEIADFRFHDLRHCAASYLAMNGASIAEIAAVLGHKTLAMVKRYAHLSDSHTAAVVERMNRKIFG